MTTLTANQTSPPRLPTTTTISTASLSLEDPTSSNTGDRCTENPHSTTKSVLRKFPTSTLQTKPTDTVVDLLINDDKPYTDTILLLSLPNVVGSHEFPTPLNSLRCNDDAFDSQSELKDLVAACEKLQQQFQAMNAPSIMPCNPHNKNQPAPTAHTPKPADPAPTTEHARQPSATEP